MHAEKTNNTFVIASLTLGILSLVSSCTVFLSIPLGALSILFAVLAHRKKKNHHAFSLIGIATSCIAIISSGVILVTTFLTLPTLLKDEEYREQLNMTSKQMYGITFDELMEDYYGVDLDSYIQKWD